ncbi:MAG: hypothetical protein QXT63_07260 [Thermoplasmata archaeon]
MQPHMDKNKKAVALVIIILAAFLCGCTATPSQPTFSAVPKLVIDYIEDENVTKIYLHGFDDHLYTNLSLNVSYENETWLAIDEYTYYLSIETNLTTFCLNATAWDNLTAYSYECKLEIVHTNNGIGFQIEDEKSTVPQRHTPPYKKMLSVMQTTKKNS